METKRRAEFESGQTLLEIVVTLAIMVLLALGLVATTTKSLKTSRYSSNKNLSVEHAQEAVEIVRNIRDGNWSTFASFGGQIPQSWCLDQNGQMTLAVGICPANIDNLFSRMVTFTWIDPKMKVEVVVSWAEGGQQFQTGLTTYFTKWR